MKFRYNKHIFAFAIGAVAAMSLYSCKDDSTDVLITQAYIEPDAFFVESASDKNVSYKAVLSEDGSKFSIQLPENLDPEKELNGAKAHFYLSMGATCTPALSEVQNFADLDNPVVYTVTSNDGGATRSYVVDYMLVGPTQVAKGEKIPSADRIAAKTWDQLGFGTRAKFETWGEYKDKDGDDIMLPLSFERGDLMGMPAFCGHDNVVVFARAYALNGKEADAFKVFDATTLAPKGTLNLGGIKPSEVVAVSSDWHGNMIAAVGRKAAGKSDLYVWTSPDEAPVLLGSTHTSVEIEEGNDDAGSYISVAGDLLGNAAIAFGGPRDADGTHYKYNVYGGQLNAEYTTIKTGHPSNDMNSFQMISFFGPKKSDSYLVGDAQKSEVKTDDSTYSMRDEIMIYVNGPDGDMRGVIDYHDTGYNGWSYDHADAGAWWQRSGQSLKRKGGRRPTVHAMVLNGYKYAFWTTGSNTIARTIITDTSLKEYQTNLGCHWGFGQTTLALFGDFGMWRRDCYGSMADWYYDDEAGEGRIAVWLDRVGLVMFKPSSVGFVTEN